jgi:phenylacetic acid degradation operon negative regulatory protein
MSPGPRRIEAGGSSARSLLLTLLGEFVLPNGGSAWTGAVIAGLASVGVEEKAARQALTRTAARGLLRADRVGRRTRWALTRTAVRLLVDGTERIYSFGSHLENWDGQWLVVLVTDPRSERRGRHQLRTRLTWEGLGSPVPGVWLTADATREKEVASILDELDVEASSFTGPFGETGDPKRLVERAWDLGDVAKRYVAFVRSFGNARPRTPEAVFSAQLRLVNEWRQFPFRDPSLPRALLPARWPGIAAVDIFHRRHSEWQETAQHRWSSLNSA